MSQTIRASAPSPTGIAFGDGVLWVVGLDRRRAPPRRSDTEEIADRPARRPALRRGVHAGRRVGLGRAEQRRARRPDGSERRASRSRWATGRPRSSPAFGSIWVANQLDGTVAAARPLDRARSRRRSPSTRARTRSRLRAARCGSANEFDDTVRVIDPDTNDVESSIPSGGAAASLASDDGGLWLAVGASATEHRGGTLTMSSASEAPDSRSTRPSGTTPVVWQIQSITNDGLVTYKKVGRSGWGHARPGPGVGAPRGLRRRPDLSIPAAPGDRVLDRRARAPRGLPARMERSISLSPRRGRPVRRARGSGGLQSGTRRVRPVRTRSSWTTRPSRSTSRARIPTCPSSSPCRSPSRSRPGPRSRIRD